MENQQQPKKQDFKIVSRPSNEEIEDWEEGSYRSKEEKIDEKATAQIDEDEMIDGGVHKDEGGFDEQYDRLEDK
ncbi:hypothetical protein [Pedobacter sp. UC225_65]|uniref:hypothetical protein n=1 Tax=Pedobacter sp. UC225_65 TaxID=3350173 RepID=UPI0036735C3B